MAPISYPEYIERPLPSMPLSPSRYIPMEPRCAEEALAARGYPAGQTVAERVKAILDAAGFGVPEPLGPAKTCGFQIDVDGERVFTCTEAPHPDTPRLHAMLDGHTGELVRCKHYGREG